MTCLDEPFTLQGNRESSQVKQLVVAFEQCKPTTICRDQSQIAQFLIGKQFLMLSNTRSLNDIKADALTAEQVFTVKETSRVQSIKVSAVLPTRHYFRVREDEANVQRL